MAGDIDVGMSSIEVIFKVSIGCKAEGKKWEHKRSIHLRQLPTD